MVLLTNVDLMLDQLLRRWINIKSTLVYCLESVGYTSLGHFCVHGEINQMMSQLKMISIVCPVADKLGGVSH